MTLETQEPKVHRVFKARRVILATKAQQVHKAFRELKDHKVQLDLKEFKVTKVTLATLVLKVQ